MAKAKFFRALFLIFSMARRGKANINSGFAKPSHGFIDKEFANCKPVETTIASPSGSKKSGFIDQRQSSGGWKN
jgi:hypothetical protein